MNGGLALRTVTGRIEDLLGRSRTFLDYSREGRGQSATTACSLRVHGLKAVTDRSRSLPARGLPAEMPRPARCLSVFRTSPRLRTVHGRGRFVDTVVTAELPLPGREHELSTVVARTRWGQFAVADLDSREDNLADTSRTNGG